MTPWERSSAPGSSSYASVGGDAAGPLTRDARLPILVLYHLPQDHAAVEEVRWTEQRQLAER